VCLCGDLTEDNYHTGLGGSLASDLGEGVLLEAGIEDGVRDLIAVVALVGFGVWRNWESESEVGCVIHWMVPCSLRNRNHEGKSVGEYIPDLVGVTLTYRLGGEEEGVLNNGKVKAGCIGAFLWKVPWGWNRW
jgi:hypothetical protein